jgi:hypothetical protein
VTDICHSYVADICHSYMTKISGVTLPFWPLALRASWTQKLVALNKIHFHQTMATGVPTVGRTTCRPILPLLYMAMLYCLRSSFGPQKNFESSTCTINNLSDNENINLKMPSMLWQGNLSNRASKIKRLLARHDIHLPRASGQVLSYTSGYLSHICNI